MTFGREKRLLLGLLALLAPLPLPFNEVLGWSGLAVFELCVLAFLWRAHHDPPRWLPVWATNLLAVAYLPFAVLDTTAHRGSIVGPVLHLGLFAVLVKLYSLGRERDKWHAVLAIFFLFLAAMATSVHLSVVLYLLGFLGVGLFLLARFAFLHLLAGFGRSDGEALRVPLLGFLAAAALATAVLAAPLFALLPRIKTPYLRGGVGGTGRGEVQAVTGFSDEVTLDTISRVRENREVALRLRFTGNRAGAMRIKGGAFDRLEGTSWKKAAANEEIRKRADERVRLHSGEPVGEAEIWLEPLASDGLPLPVNTQSFTLPRRSLRLDRGGAFHFSYQPNEAVGYQVRLGRRAASVAAPPAGPDEPILDTAAVTPEMADLAASWTEGLATPGERADALQDHLLREYDYTLDFVGRSAARPIEDFLFTYKSGHCELFASSLVLLLRSQGIPARLVSGFLGGELDPLGYWVVRQSNAHAWVDAWLPERGWTLFDPTPPAGRPTATEQSLLAYAGQLYETLVFQWDRHVLTYSAEDQFDVIRRGFNAFSALWRRLTGREERPAPGAAPVPSDEPVAGTAAPAESPWPRRLTFAVLLPLIVGLLVALWLRRRDPHSGTRAYRELRHRLARAGVPLTAATAPLAVESAARRHRPAAGEPAARVVRLYLAESFGGSRLGEGERQSLRAALAETRRALRKAG